MALNKYLSLSVGSLIFSQLISAGIASAESPLLIKAKGQSAVYWVQGTTRHPFPLLGVYRSWFGDSFSGVTEVPLSELSNYTLTKNVLFKPGSLIKIQTDPKVYRVVDESGKLEWIQTEEEFKKRGLSFKDVQDVPDTFFPDYTTPTDSDFATPQNSQNENPMSTSTPGSETQNQPVIPLSIQNAGVTSSKGLSGTQATFSLSVTQPASVIVEYAPVEGTTSTFNLASGTNFTKTVSVASGVEYRYVITATTAQGAQTLQTGKFVSYTDISASGITNAVPLNAALAKPVVLVGGFTIKNNSSELRTSTQFTFQFNSESSITKNVAKTIQIVRLNGDNSIGDVLIEKTIGSGTAITNESNLQKIAGGEDIAPGETKRYGIVIKNLDQMNIDLASPSETFVPYLAAVDFLGDTSIVYTNTKLATLTYQRGQ